MQDANYSLQCLSAVGRGEIIIITYVFDDSGLRVQYSFFECHLDQTNFDRLWERLNDLIDPEQDRIVAYQLDQLSAKRTLTAGNMVCAEKVIVYLI